jgi:hypothetical protein
MVAGSEVTGHVMLLSNTGVHQQPVWPSCYGPLSVPVGVSKYTVAVIAGYSMCHLKGPPPVCNKDGRLSSPFAPTPPPITVLVTR